MGVKRYIKDFSLKISLFKKEFFNIGLEIKTSKSGNFIIASKEKALCDKVYFTKDIDINTYKDEMQKIVAGLSRK